MFSNTAICLATLLLHAFYRVKSLATCQKWNSISIQNREFDLIYVVGFDHNSSSVLKCKEIQIAVLIN